VAASAPRTVHTTGFNTEGQRADELKSSAGELGSSARAGDGAREAVGLALSVGRRDGVAVAGTISWGIIVGLGLLVLGDMVGFSGGKSVGLVGGWVVLLGSGNKVELPGGITVGPLVMGERVGLVPTGAAVGLPGDTMVGALVTGANDGPGVTMPELIDNTSTVVPSVVT